MYMYMEIHVYSTLAYTRVGREERQPTQTKKTMNMHVHVPVHQRLNNNIFEDTRTPSFENWDVRVQCAWDSQWQVHVQTNASVRDM